MKAHTHLKLMFYVREMGITCSPCCVCIVNVVGMTTVCYVQCVRYEQASISLSENDVDVASTHRRIECEVRASERC